MSVLGIFLARIFRDYSDWVRGSPGVGAVCCLGGRLVAGRRVVASRGYFPGILSL